MAREQFLSRRVYVLVAVMGLWGTAIGTRLYFLQVLGASDFRDRAAKQQQQTLEISPPRGYIYDRAGSELAASITAKSVFAVPIEVKDADATAKTLSSITGQSRSEITAKLKSERRFVYIKRKVTVEEASSIEHANLSGIHFEDESQRFYPNGELAAQVLGYVGVDEQGLGGIENKYNETIQGNSGEVIYLTDAHGKSFNQIARPAQPGANLVTTIDKNIQHFVEQEVRDAEDRTHARGIYVVVMDPRNGEVLAMATSPTFNPNDFKATSMESRQNGVISHTYEPGSTFKILTVGAGLEEGLITPDDRIDCQMGSITVAGKLIHDHKPFGVLTISEILQNSSDVGAIKVGLQLADERMARYIKLFGFGKPTGIDLPGEERGLARPVSKWRKSSIGYLSMGQEISVTPLQIASLISMVANGGTLYRPYVVKEIQDPVKGVVSRTEPSGTRVMSQKSAQEMQSMLEKVVTDGTAKSAKLDGYRAAGKTGTAQKADGKGGYASAKMVASFAGFAPASNPVISMVVVVDEPVGAHHGGEIAAPIFKHIADQVLHYRGIAPDIEGYAPPRYIAAPVRPAPPSSTKPAPEEMKIVGAKFTGGPAAPVLDAGDITVPDFHGKPMSQVHNEIRQLGLTDTYSGHGRITQQYPPAGSKVRLGTEVELLLSTK
jgi:cell division protein FtsI (penicillin-binding protein 3)